MSETMTLYYFTGTGNSLAAARALAVELDDPALVPIARIWQQDQVRDDSQVVGFVFPLYFSGLPLIVRAFVEKLELGQPEYIFAVITRKSLFSGGAVWELSRLLRRKGHRLDGGFYVDMIGNYIPNYGLPIEEERKIILADAGLRIREIAKAIRNRRRKRQFAPLDFLAPLLHRNFVNTVHESDENFRATDRCTSCGTCVQLCPVEDIHLVNGRPEWLHHCQQCLACLHFCPEEAIQYGEKTEERDRYHHPYTNVQDIIGQNEPE
jgi:ferredoxin